MKFVITWIVTLSLMLAGQLRAEEDPVLDEVFASRGGVSVTHREFEAAIAHIPEEDRAAFLRDGRRLERVLANLLTQKKLATDAVAAGFDQTPGMQDRMELSAMRTLSEAWLKNYLDNRPHAKYEDMAREQYLLDPERYQSERSLDVSHILVSNQERSTEEALEIAQGVIQKLQNNEETWDSLVMSVSEDPSAVSNGGYFKNIKPGDMVKPFEDAAFSLEPGEISEPVLTQYGYHVIRLDGINEPRQQTFEEVKDRLIESQKTLHRRRARTDYLNEIGAPPTDLPAENLMKMLSRHFDEDQLNMPDKE